MRNEEGGCFIQENCSVFVNEFRAQGASTVDLCTDKVIAKCKTLGICSAQNKFWTKSDRPILGIIVYLL